MGRFVKNWLPVIVWMIVIFSASTQLGTAEHSSRIFRPLMLWLFPDISETSLDTAHYYFRKIGHLSEYALLAILMWHALKSMASVTRSRGVWGQFLLVILCCALYAGTDELHQLFVASREARVTDVLIDTCGASIGALIFLGGIRWRCRQR